MAQSEYTPHPHRQLWDTRYHEGYQPRQPSALLQRWLACLHPASGRNRALDLACGAGRNTLLLAEHGWRVLGIDISPVALQIAHSEAQRRGIRLDLLAANLQDWPLPVAHFDLVCVFRFLDRSLCPHLAATLRPGGILIYETFTTAQRNYEGGPRSDAMLLQAGELPALFPTLKILEHREGVIEEGGRPRALASLVGVLS